MLKSRQLLLMLGGVIALFALVKGIEYVNRERTTVQVREFIAIAQQEYNRLEILYPGRELVVLTRNGEDWELVAPLAYPANQANVISLTRRLEEVNSENIVSTLPASWGNYEVDDRAITVTLRAGQEDVLTFYVGKQAPAGFHTYMRLAGSDETHMVRGDIRSFLRYTVNEWRNKTIVDLPQQSIQRIGVSATPERSFALMRDNDLWRVEDLAGERFPADPNEANMLVGTLATLAALTFPPESAVESLDFTEPTMEIILTQTGGLATTLQLVESNGAYYLVKDGGDTVFEVAGYIYDDLDREPGELVLDAGATGESGEAE